MMNLFLWLLFVVFATVYVMVVIVWVRLVFGFPRKKKADRQNNYEGQHVDKDIQQ